MRIKTMASLGLAGVGVLIAGPVAASLTGFQTFVGKVGVSTDGFGSLSSSGTISASVPSGSTVLGAYLYSSQIAGSPNSAGGTLGGNALSYGAPVLNPNGVAMARADVTALVKPLIDGGPGGIYNFTVTENHTFQTDGEALVVVYSNPVLATSTVGILDGFSASGGDSTAINFADPLNPAAPGFFAEMRLGIGYSCCNQKSTVTVNGVKITENAGNNDDGVGNLSNGQLITVGGFDDPFSALLPPYQDDHERYDLVPYITAGDTSIKVDTLNPSNDDNIFLAVFHVAGKAGINEPPPPSTVPEPTTLALLGMGMVGLAAKRRRRSSL